MSYHPDGRTQPGRLTAAQHHAWQALVAAAPVLSVVLVLVVAVAAGRFVLFSVPSDVITRDLQGLQTAAAAATPRPTATASPGALTAFERGTLASQARTAAVQALGGLVLILGAVLTIRSLRVTREGQITDRFTAAAQHLGEERISVRVAAIHALGRIARDSRADHGAVMAILGDHLREYCAWPARLGGERPSGAVAKPDNAPHPEVNAAALVLRRRRRRRDEGALDLSGIDWRDAPLSGTQLQGSSLVDANFQDAFLNGANLQDAVLVRTKLGGASLRRADLRDATIRYADFSHADAEGADLRHTKHVDSAVFEMTWLKDARLPPGARVDGAVFDDE
jgi:uncharacterized protein YjbI with pentapeptide repeats